MRENAFCMVFHVRWISHHSSPNPTLVATRLGRDSETRGEKTPSHMENHTKCIYSQFARPIPSRTTQFQQRMDGRENSVPPGYCFEFHYEDKCSERSCTYNHTCFKCHKPGHSTSKCRSGQPWPSSIITKPSK